jgi:hypothetical protein
MREREIMKVRSKEITYRSIIEQVFFDDDSELLIKTGWAEGQEADLDVSHWWPMEEPEWAKGMTTQELNTMKERE